MVTVMMSATTRTSPFSVRQPQVLLDVSTLATGLATRKEPVYLDDGSPIPCCLVQQLPHQFIPPAISNRSCEFVVLHHILDSKRLHADDLVFINQLAGRLMQIVLPYVFDPLVYSRQLATKFLDTSGLLVGSLVPPVTEFSLYSFYLSPERAVRLDVSVLVAVAVHHQRLDTKVYAYLALDLLEWLDFLLYHQGAVVLTTLVPADRAVRDFFWYVTMYLALDAFLELRDGQLAVHQLDVLWHTEGLLIVLGLERRELCPALKEVVVRRLQVLDGVLEALAVHFTEPCQHLLQLGQVVAVLEEAVALAVMEVLFLPLGEEVVVQVSCAAKVLGEQDTLFLVRVEPKPVCVFYTHILM